MGSTEEEGNASDVSDQNQVHLGLTCEILVCPEAGSYRGTGGKKRNNIAEEIERLVETSGILGERGWEGCQHFFLSKLN